MSIPLVGPRRTLLARLIAGAASGMAGVGAAVNNARAASGLDLPPWPAKLQARHRQLFDGIDSGNGPVLEFAHNFLASNPPMMAAAVIILRASAVPLALDHAIWAKYKIGESLRINDPETNAPAVKNPFLHPKPGVLRSDDAAIDRLLAAGAIFGACDVALHGHSKRLAHNAGVSTEEAAAEWTANVIPGIQIIPSGVWGVNRAQEAGCTYCAGG
jgi:hypothetical protein